MISLLLAAAFSGDAQDLLLLLDDRPYLIRLHLRIDGRSFHESWEGTIGQLFRYLDADGDGALSKKEAALAPSVTQWLQLMNGVPVEPDAAPDFAALAGGEKETKATRQRFIDYYLRSPAGALQIEYGWRPSSEDKPGDALFRQLDADKDGVLSRAELRNASAALRPLDGDGDEIIHVTELSRTGAYPVFVYRSAIDQQPLPKTFPILLVSNDTTKGKAMARLRERYGKNKGDLPKRPDLELTIPLERYSRRDFLVVPPAVSKENGLAARTPPRDGSLRIPLGANQLELIRRRGVSEVRKNLLTQFDAMAGKKGVLSEKAIYQPPFTFVALLRLADRDGDDRLSRTEIDSFLDMQEKFFFRSTYLTVVDRGESLFEALDADHDGRLGERELRMAWKRLEPFDREQAGRITRAQVPRQFQLIVSHGQPRGSIPVPNGGGYADVPLFRDRGRGPLWFRKMDRNGDGDVSPSEFLGGSEQFRRIDADGDGLIDVAEAERADRKLRK